MTKNRWWRARRGGAFTLVEILIVVVILGILGAVVIPQFTNAGEDAKASSLVTNLQTIRSQLELYKLQHSGVYPTNYKTFTDQMTKKTTVAGVTKNGTLGPYLLSIPNNPFTATNNVSSNDKAVSAWYYLVSKDGVATFKANDGNATNEAL